MTHNCISFLTSSDYLQIIQKDYYYIKDLFSAIESNNNHELWNVIKTKPHFINFQRPDDSFTPLHLALSLLNGEMVSYLVKQNANFECINSKGENITEFFKNSIISKDRNIFEEKDFRDIANIQQILGKIPSQSAIEGFYEN